MDAPFRSFSASFAASCLLLAASGCASTWDEVWSHERDWRYITGINRPDPLVVLRDSTDGHRRAQALGDLREPLQNGGDAQEQELYLKILDTAAASDAEPICRLTAIRTLGKYRDPRAARSLEDIYKLPSKQPKSSEDRVLNFTLEINSMIRKEALVALATTEDADAWKLLVNVARGPGPLLEANLTDRQQTQDEKIVAISALGKYRHQECVDALAHVMKTERDIALRDRALTSLEESTGKKWPAKRDEWLKEDIRPQPGLAAQEDKSMLRLIGFSPK